MNNPFSGSGVALVTPFKEDKSIDFTDQKETFHFEEKVELISKSDFLEYAFNSGLTWTGMLGDYQLNSFDDQNSPRMIFLWTKN